MIKEVVEILEIKVNERLRAVREKKYKTKREMSLAVGMSDITYCFIENGRLNPTKEEQKKIAKKLNVSIDEIF